MDFIMNVIAGVVVFVIIALIAVIWGTIKMMYAGGYHIEIGKRFPDVAEADSDINQKMAHSRTIRILAMRQAALADDKKPVYSNLWASQAGNKHVEVILSSPKNVAAITKRAASCRMTPDEYIQQLEKSFEFLQRKRQGTSLEIGEHQELLSYGLVILDDYIYVFYYDDDKRRSEFTFAVRFRKRPMFSYGESVAYRGFELYYEHVKNISEFTAS